MLTLARDLTCALDPAYFARLRLGFAPDDWQAGVLRSPSKRLLLNCSRQSGKSTVASVLALHTALYIPEALVLLVSPSLRQSSELFKKVGAFLAKLDTQPTKTEDNKLSLTLATGSRVVSLPSSEGTIRGFSGATLIVEDEASRVGDDLYRAVRPMLAVSGGRFILMSTPFGKRGHFHDEWVNGGDQWERVEIPAAACPRIPAAFLEEERRSLGDWWYSQEYECQFHDTVDSVFSYDVVTAAFSADVPPLFSQFGDDG